MHKNILMVYPEIPKDTYWSFSHALPFIGRKVGMPPLGLITVASMLPEDYDVRLVDMNIQDLEDEDIKWADAVFTSSMVLQKESLDNVISRANSFSVPVVAGGPYPTQFFMDIEGADHFVLGEAESGVLERFISDFEKGNAKKVYADHVIRKIEKEKAIDEKLLAELLDFFPESERDIKIVSERPSMSDSPLPRFELLDMGAYASMAVQLSRGCPHMCEFCNEPTLFGHKPRLKTSERMVEELNRIYKLGFRGSVFVVDDNFIGNRKMVKSVLEDVKNFQTKKGYPLSLYTEADISLSLDDELMELMRDAGFNMVFVGLESPDKEVLRAMGKMQNVKVDLVDSVRKIQSYGMEITAGFIVGNDNDPDDICDKIFEFCQEAGIPMAMVGLLTAMKGSVLYENLNSAGRLLSDSCGNNTHDFRFNFIPKADPAKIIQDYKVLLARLYDKSGKNYFSRVENLLDNLGYHPKPSRSIRFKEIRALGLSLLRQTFLKPYSPAYRSFISKSLFSRTKVFPEAVTKAIMGHHFYEITHSALRTDSSYTAKKLFDHFINEADSFKAKMESLCSSYSGRKDEMLEKIAEEKDRFFEQAKTKAVLLPRQYRRKLMEAYNTQISSFARDLSDISV